jgi:hypothetical protein
MASNNLQNKFIQNYGIEILKRREIWVKQPTNHTRIILGIK